MESNSYLHLIRKNDERRIMNFKSSNRLYSLLYEQILLSQDANLKNPMHVDIDDLRFNSDKIFTTIVNPRLFYLVENSMLQKNKNGLIVNKKKLSNKVISDVKNIAELEIEFEQGRRLFAPSMPSRLSCLYLVKNDIYGRENLSKMFSESIKNPMILEVEIVDKLELYSVDFRWINVYRKTKDMSAIKNYWNSKSFDENHNAKEYLLEGSISITNEEQIQEL